MNTTTKQLVSILPSKRIINRILFDQDARLSYKKMYPVLTNIYNNLKTPELIKLPTYITSNDLMEFQSLLKQLRNLTSTINKNLIELENELIEQSAELGNYDAITILSFNTIKNKLKKDSTVSDSDFTHANKLIQQLLDLNHPLTLKYAGDLAFDEKIYKKAITYWKLFITKESNTLRSSHVYYQLGYYYLTFESNPFEAKKYFEKSIEVGEVDNITSKSYFYLGQLNVDSNPRLARSYWEISSSKGLIDSIINLGFLEMNIFNNLKIAIEWFKLGVELNSDLNCLIGQFDCLIKLNDFKKAKLILKNLNDLNEKINTVNNVPNHLINSKIENENILKLFFKTRIKDIEKLNEIIN